LSNESLRCVLAQEGARARRAARARHGAEGAFLLSLPNAWASGAHLAHSRVLAPPSKGGVLASPKGNQWGTIWGVSSIGRPQRVDPTATAQSCPPMVPKTSQPGRCTAGPRRPVGPRRPHKGFTPETSRDARALAPSALLPNDATAPTAGGQPASAQKLCCVNAAG